MARFLKGITGAYSGKIGNVVGSNWRNVNYIRSLPKKSNKAATEAQLVQRAKFALAIAFISPIKDVINLGYSDKLQRNVSGFNVAVRAILNAGIDGVYPELLISYPNVQISKGPHAPLIGLQMVESAPQQLILSWNNVINRFNSFADDSVIVLLYDVQAKMFSIFEGVTRKEELYVIQFPAIYAGKTVVGWAFTGHRDGVKTSSSQYLGKITLS